MPDDPPTMEHTPNGILMDGKRPSGKWAFLDILTREGALEESWAEYWGYTERVFPDEPVDVWASFLGDVV